MEYADVKYVVCGKSDRVVDAYVAPYIQPVRTDTDLATIRQMTAALKIKSGFEWTIAVRDVDSKNRFVPIEITDEERDLPMLSTELYRYTKSMTQQLRDGKLPVFNRDHIGDRAPALVQVVILTENKEHQMLMPVDAYMSFSAACAKYYGPYGTLPWGIKRAISAHTQQFHIRLCDDNEMTYLSCMTASRNMDIKISPIIDCGDILTTLRETARFTDAITESFRAYTLIGRDLPDTTAAPTRDQGHRLGSK